MNGGAVERLILVIDDQPMHVQTIEQALNGEGMGYRLVAIAHPQAALDFLNRRGQYADALRPDLVLLDLNIAEAAGLELLQEIKSTPTLRRIPIVVLTTSSNSDDILQAYTLQGNCYVIKSSDLNQLFQIVKRIEEFWLGIVTLPVE